VERGALLRVIVAVGVLLAQLPYWAAVTDVLGLAAGGGCGYWSSGPPSRLLPWPSPSGLLDVITRMEPWDTAVCMSYRSGAFLLAMAAVTLVSDFLLRRFLARRQGLTGNDPSP
jgi:hypothetical protein